MYVVYKPSDGDEQVWEYDPNKLLCAERELIEKRTGMRFTDWTEEVVKGGSLARRALLYVMQKRKHPTIKWDDVEFMWDQLDVEFSRDELLEIRAAVVEDDTADAEERTEALAGLDEQIKTARSGKEGTVPPVNDD